MDPQPLIASLLAHTHEGIVVTDAEAIIVDVNNAFSELTGYSRAEVLGRNPRFLQAGHHPPEYYSKLWRVLREQGCWQGELRNRRKDGRMVAERVTIAAIVDEYGVTTHYLGLFSDITESTNSRRLLHQIAYHDALTGLPNRLLLLDRLQNTVARADREKILLAVCYLDLDGFKPVNDLLGQMGF